MIININENTDTLAVLSFKIVFHVIVHMLVLKV